MKDPARADRSQYLIQECVWTARVLFMTPRSMTDHWRVIADVESREMAERLVDAEVAYHSEPESTPDPRENP